MAGSAGEDLCRDGGTTSGDKKVEGWLYLIAARRWRGQFPHRRYFILENGVTSCYKSKPSDGGENPRRKGIIDPYTRVTDNGRESIHGMVLFVFTIYDSVNNENQLKFGARSAEEAAKWMSAFKATAEQGQPKGKSGGAFVPSHGKRRLPFRKRGGSGIINYPSGGLDSFHADDGAGVPDWTGALSFKDGSPDVVADSPWRIIGCKNGLRLFMETTDPPGFEKHGLRSMLFKDDQAALMSVGVVNANCECIFQTAMALGPSRHEWDFCYLRGKVIEHIDGHTDIINKQFHSGWMSRRMKPRDLVLLRYWRREDDGSYVILYRSVKHDSCPRRRGFVRAELKSGGYVISPLQSRGGHSRVLVRHMITADWKVRSSCIHPMDEQKITLRVLERVAAIREVYKTRPATSLFVSTMRPADSFMSLKDATAVSNGVDANKTQVEIKVGETVYTPKSPEGTQDSPGAGDSLFLQLGDGDEFYDVQEDASWWKADEGNLRTETEGMFDDPDKVKSPRVPKFSAAATIVKRLHDLADKVKKQQPDIGDNVDIEPEVLSKDGSLPKGSDGVVSSCWDTADVDTFLIRSKTYLRDNQKVKAGDPRMQFVAADWLRSDKREDNLANRPSNVVQVLTSRFQRSSVKGRTPYFFVINLQVPGITTHSLCLYYMTFRGPEDDSLLEKFVTGDDRFRNARFKLIPHIAKGSWIVKQSVGKTACLIGQALTIDYHKGSNYVELDVDIGSSSVAKGVVNLVLGYLSKLVIEMAFLIQADTEDELPERLLGTCRLSYLDINKAVPAAAD